ATAAGEPAPMMEAAQRFVQRHPRSAHVDGATLAVGVARDLSGHHGDAATALATIAHDRSGPRRVAAALLHSPRLHPFGDLQAAEQHHARSVAEYVLVGGGPDGRTMLYTASRMGAQGLQGAESFGVFNVIGLLTRAWHAWRKDPVSNQAIIDAGEHLLDDEPDTPKASEVHARLAK